MTDRGWWYVTPPTNRERSALTPWKEPLSSGGHKEAKLAHCDAEGSDSQPRARQEELSTTSGTVIIRSQLKGLVNPNYKRNILTHVPPVV